MEDQTVFLLRIRLLRDASSPLSLSFLETTLLFHSDPSSCCLVLCYFVIDTADAVFAHVGVIIIFVVLLLAV